MNCTSGEWFVERFLIFFSLFFFLFLSIYFLNFPREEIPVFLEGSFLISIPLDTPSEDNCEEKVECVSGDTYAGLTDTTGCEVKYIIYIYIYNIFYIYIYVYF